MDASHSPIIRASSTVADKLHNASACARAVENMQRYDPEFDLEDLGDEAMEIFQEFYCNYLTGNTEYIDMVCGGTAGAQLKALIEMRVKEGWEYKY